MVKLGAFVRCNSEGASHNFWTKRWLFGGANAMRKGVLRPCWRGRGGERGPEMSCVEWRGHV